MAVNFFKVSKGLSLGAQTSTPSSPNDGDIIFNSTSGTLQIYQGGSWTNLASKTDVATAASLTSASLTSAVMQNSLIRLTGSTVSDLHGLTSASSAKTAVLYNASSVAVTIKHQSATEGTAANRIITASGADTVLDAGYSATFMYDDTQSRWVYIAPVSGGGGGGGNIFNGNTNLTGPYYGEVVVYGGNATITGNLSIFGNLLVEGNLLCTGDYTIDVKGDVTVTGKFDYIPTANGQNINIEGDLTVKGAPSQLGGPYTVTNVGFIEFETPNGPALDGVAVGHTISLEVGSTNYPYSDVITDIQVDTPSPGTTTIYLQSPIPFDTSDTWEVLVTENIQINTKAANTLTVGGDLHTAGLNGVSTSSGIPGLNLNIGGSIHGIQVIENPTELCIINISGNNLGSSVGGNLNVKGSVYNTTVYAKGGNSGATPAPGNGGSITIAGDWTASFNTLDTAGGNQDHANATPAGNGGSIVVLGEVTGLLLYAPGGDSSGVASANSHGGNGGAITVYGNCISDVTASGGSCNHTDGRGGDGGNVNIYGNNKGAIYSNGGSGNGSTYRGGHGGTIYIRNNTSHGGVGAVGGYGAGTSCAGGNGGTVQIQGDASIYSYNINIYGGASSFSGNAVGGTGGSLTIYGYITCSSINTSGGNGIGTGNGGTAGSIYNYGYINAVDGVTVKGGNTSSGTAGSPSSVDLRGGCRIATLTMTDGTGGTAPTTTPILSLGGTCNINKIDMTNRTGLTIRGYASGSNTTTTLRVNQLPGKNIFSSASNTNPTTPQVGLCVHRTYTYDAVGLMWKYATHINATGPNTSVVNLIEDGDGESGVTNFVEGSYSAATRPAGTFTASSGTGTLAISTSSSDPLFGLNSLLITKTTGSSRQGRAIERTITLDKGYRTKVLQLEIDYQIVSGTFVAGSNTTDSSLIWYMSEYNGSTWSMKEPSSFKMLSNSTTSPDKLIGNFQVNSDTTQIKLIAYVAETASTDWVVKCEVAIKPCSYVYGTPISDWQSYTPSTGATNTTYTAKYRRVGDTLEGVVGFAFTGAPSIFTDIAIPTGLTIDTSKVGTTVNYSSNIGMGMIFDNAGVAQPLHVSYQSTTTVRINYEAATSNQIAPCNPTSPYTIGNGDTAQVNFRVPITGWSSSVQQSDGYDGRLVAAKAYGCATSVANTASGTLVFTASLTDKTNSYSTSTGLFTAPSAGTYRVTVHVSTNQVAHSANGYAYLYPLKNGSTGPAIMIRNWESTASVYAAFGGSTQVDLNAGDTLGVRLTNQSGATLTCNGTDENSISFEKLSSPTTISATETVAARYNGTVTGSIGGVFNTITYPNKVVDTHGAYSNGTYTIPVAGLYQISASVEITGTEALNSESTLTAYVNGTSDLYLGSIRSPGAVGSTTVTGSGLINVNARDLVTIRFYTDIGSPAYTTTTIVSSFSIHKIK